MNTNNIEWRVRDLTMKQDHRNCYNELEVGLVGLTSMYLSPQDLANMNNEIERKLNSGEVAPKYMPYRDYARMRDAKSKFEIKDVIFNDPATIVFWTDGTKTVVKVQDGDEFDPEKGLTMAITKKLYGNTGSYCNLIKKWCEPYYEKEAEEAEAFMSELKIQHALAVIGEAASRVLADIEKCEEALETEKYNPVEEAYMQINNFLNGKGSLDLDEIRGFLGEALAE